MKPRSVNPIDADTLAKLTSADNEARLEAEMQIALLGDDAIPALLGAIEREADSYRSSRRFFTCLQLVMGAILAHYLLTALYSGFVLGNWSPPSDGSNLVLFLGALGAMQGLVTQSHKNAVSKLSEFNDIRIAGALLEAAERNDKSLKTIAERTLVRLLPRLTAANNPLNESQLASLNRALKSDNSELVVAALKALEEIGDETHVEQVKRLAYQKAKNPFQETVRDKALACLPYLEKRAENAKMAKTLLRASAPHNTDNTLLRPASHTPESRPEELLRPITPPSPDSAESINTHSAR